MISIKQNRVHLLNNYFSYNNINKRIRSQFNRKSHYQSFHGEIKYIIFMKEQQTTEFYGVDVSDWSIVPLRSQELNDELKSRYLPERGHLFSEALQHGSSVPNQKNMVRTVNRNKDKLSLALRLKDVVNSWNPINTRPKLTRRLRNKKNMKRDKQPKLEIPPMKSKAFKIMSPEAIVVKCAKRAFERTLQQREDEILLQGKIRKEVSPYFQKKKLNQQKRRMERCILIKAFKWQLLEVFGQIIFSKRWRIGKQQLLNALDLVPSQINYPYLVSFIQERKNYRTVRDHVSDHRLVRFIYNNPFRTLMRKNIVQYNLKIENQKKYERREKVGKQFRKKKTITLRQQRLFGSLKQKTNKKAVDRLASSTLMEQILIKEQEFEESETETVQTDSAEPLNTISSS